MSGRRSAAISRILRKTLLNYATGQRNQDGKQKNAFKLPAGDLESPLPSQAARVSQLSMVAASTRPACWN